MKIVSFNADNIKQVREVVNAKLAELKDLGIEVQLGNISYNANSFTSKLEFRVAGGPDIFEAEFRKSGKSHSYPNAIGKTVQVSGKQFTFKGLRPRARVKDAIIEDANGKTFRINFHVIASQLV